MRYLNLHTLTIIQPFWDLIRSHEISQYLLRSPKIFWGIIRSTEISSINWFDILHLILIHDTWHLTLICFWHWYAVTFDNWYLTSMQNLSDCIAVSRNILMLLIALYCTHCRSLPFLYTLHSSQVMLWGRQRAERLPCFMKSVKFCQSALLTFESSFLLEKVPIGLHFIV